MSRLKGIDTNDEKLRFWKLLENVVDVKSQTKRKPATITLKVPQELADYVIKAFMGGPGSIDAEQFLITYRLKEVPEKLPEEN